MDISKFRFGIEIELYNIKRSQVANCVKSIVGKQCDITEYRTRRGLCYKVADGKNIWYCKCDASLHNQLNAKKPYSQENTCELVSPILTISDLDTLVSIVKEIVKAGGKCDYDHGCVVHVHVDDSLFSLHELINVLTYHYVLYPDLAKKFKFTKDQIDDRIKNLSNKFIDYLQINNITELRQIETAWYKYLSTEQKSKPYNKSRYSVINLHSLFYNKTGVEFRYFKLDKITPDYIRAIVIFLENIILFTAKDSDIYYRKLEDIIPKFDISEEDRSDIYQLLGMVK